VVVNGNDPRCIDVAICSRLPIRRISSWRFWPDPAGAPVFSRDLLQAEIRIPGGTPLQVFVNHLKSNFITDEFRLTADEIAAERHAITPAAPTRPTHRGDPAPAPAHPPRHRARRHERRPHQRPAGRGEPGRPGRAHHPGHHHPRPHPGRDAARSTDHLRCLIDRLGSVKITV
jgi:endonuclease/exonuclease/phosphatase family metal-dependent hydrolase